MIEVIYKDEKQEAKGSEGMFSVPKNIRQIGQAGENYRIYMEDYAYTFLKKKAGAVNEGQDGGCLAVLTGESKWIGGVTYIFIRGALAVENAEISAEHIDFTEEMWKGIHEELKKYFEGQEIAGWFFAARSLSMETTDLFQRVHLRHFGGGEKVLMLMDPAEQEEAFFRYENNFLVRQTGYYLYYEKNPQMQTYMLEKIPDISGAEQETVQDDAVKAFRRIIGKKKTEEPAEAEEKPSVFSYAATACLVMAVAAVGIRFYQNYQHVQEQNVKTEAAASILDDTKEIQETAAETEKAAVSPAAQAERKSEKETADITPTPKIMENSGEPDQDGTETLTEEDKAIYREESDVRKAERRVQAARENRENKEATENTENTDNTEENEEREISSETIANGAAESGISYIIRPGDTLYQISLEKYGTMDKINEICRMNGISEDELIYPGQIIVLP
ncbi:MAG TPA: LysM peptidoglycan-binding domain-containing protein [Candidatus Blautia excrementigallinarum]|nr:LysM peptidoglycan-binding domain-containing protein [Candidatus Blautia excrementigallinarum]